MLDQTLTCMTLIRYETYLGNFAKNNTNVWYSTHHTLLDLGKSGLIVLQIA